MVVQWLCSCDEVAHNALQKEPFSTIEPRSRVSAHVRSKEYQMQIETIRAVRDLLTVMQRRDQIPAVRTLVESYITDDHLADLDRAIRKWREPVTFRLEVPGYVLFGQGQDVFPRRLPPKMTGIYIAHAVFEAGEAAPSIARCEDFGKTAKGLDNALTAAANWFEAEGCEALAVAIRGISVSKEGRPSYKGDIVVNVL